MKAFPLKFAVIGAIICCVSLGIKVTSGTPEKHLASDGREYIIESEYKYNWFEAANECARRNSQLVTIDSEEKNTIIIDLLKEVIGETHNLWLGGNDQFNLSTEKDRPFFWSATGTKFQFTYWADVQPSNYLKQEHCVQISKRSPEYQWNDESCYSKMGFICEDNRFLEMYDIDCYAVNKNHSAIFYKFKRLQKDHMNQLNTRLQALEQVVKDEALEMQKLQNATESVVQKLIEQQELNAKNWWEKLQKQNTELNKQITQSMEQLNTTFVKKNSMLLFHIH